MSELSKRITIGKLHVTVSEKYRKGKNFVDQAEELTVVLARIKGLLTEPKLLTCVRCGATYDHEKYGDSPILGEISNVFQLVVTDSRSKESIFFCHGCRHLFITKNNNFINVVRGE